MADSPDAQRAADQITQRLMADPVLGPLLQRQAAGQPFDSNAADARLRQLGIELPKGMWISGGKVQHENMTVDNIGKALKIGLPIVMTAGALGAFGAPSVLSGAGGAAGGGGYIGADVASTAGSSLGAGAGAGAAGGGAAIVGAKVPSLLHQLLPTIIGAGTQLGGAAIASHGQSEAAKIQAEQADRALKVQQEQYALQRQDTAPYRALGQGAVGNLGYLSGIDTQSRVPELSSTVPKQPYGTDASHPAPYVVPGARGANGAQFPGAGQPDPYGTPGAAPTASLGQLGAPPMVQVRSPQGTVGMIPADQLQRALSMGGTRV